MSMWKAFGRGFDSRRLHHIISLPRSQEVTKQIVRFSSSLRAFVANWSILLLVVSSAQAVAQQDSIQLFQSNQKSAIPLQNIEGRPYVKLADLQPVFKFQTNPLGANLSLTLGSANILLSPNRSLVSVN